jgi:hypothetical protein
MRTGLAVGLAVAALVWSVAALPRGRGQEDPRPNVILVVTDDQPAGSIPNPYAVMPFLQRRALDPDDHWVVFENGYVNTPLCCPSRATMLTGRFAHHTVFKTGTECCSTRPRRSRRGYDEGYHTGLVSKYEPVSVERTAYVPPDGMAGGDGITARDERTSTTLLGRIMSSYGRTDADYATNALAERRPSSFASAGRSAVLPVVSVKPLPTHLDRGAEGRGRSPASWFRRRPRSERPM